MELGDEFCPGCTFPLKLPDGSNDRSVLDTDGDGTPNYLDTDSDNDGILDATEWLRAGGTACSS